MGMNLRIRNVKIALSVMCLYGLMHGIAMTYVNAVITTIEKRFNLNAADIGWLLGANDIGYLSCVLFVAYLGSRGNKPLILALSSIGIWLACLLLASPYFIYGAKMSAPELLEQTMNSTFASKSLCQANSTSFSTERPPPQSRDKSVLISFILQMIGGILSGVASCPFWNIGIALLDDMSHGKSGLYLGIVFTTRALSPVLGFLFAGWCLKMHETLAIFSSAVPGGEMNTKYIGAWWFGWVVAGFGILLTAPLLALMRADHHSEEEGVQSQTPERPHELREQCEDRSGQTDMDLPAVELKEGREDTESPEEDTRKTEDNVDEKVDLSAFKNLSIKELFMIVWELLRNRVYAYLLLGMIFEMAGFLVAVNFFTKYLTVYYRVSFSTASSLTAFSMPGSAILSNIISGVISKFTNWSIRQMNLFHFFSNAVSAVMFISLLFISCEPAQLKGVNLPFSQNETNCMSQCQCSSNSEYSPVCYNQHTYFSPCQAGCSTKINATTFGGCGCGAGFGTAGPCETVCSGVIPYVVLFFIVKAVGSIARVQFTTIIMRQTTAKRKPLSLALVGMIFGVLGICLPPLGGKVFDTICLIQNAPSKTGGKGYCLLYDVEKLRWLFNGIPLIFQIPACVLYFLSYRATPPDEEEKIKEEPSELAAVSGQNQENGDFDGRSKIENGSFN